MLPFCQTLVVSVRDGQGNGSGVAGALHSLLDWWLALQTGRCFYLRLWHLDGQQSSWPQRKEFALFNFMRKNRSPLQTSWLCTALLLSESLVRWYHRWPFPVGTDRGWRQLTETRTSNISSFSEMHTSPMDVNAATKLISVGIVLNFPAWKKNYHLQFCRNAVFRNIPWAPQEYLLRN